MTMNALGKVPDPHLRNPYVRKLLIAIEEAEEHFLPVEIGEGLRTTVFLVYEFASDPSKAGALFYPSESERWGSPAVEDTEEGALCVVRLILEALEGITFAEATRVLSRFVRIPHIDFVETDDSAELHVRIGTRARTDRRSGLDRSTRTLRAAPRRIGQRRGLS